MPASLPRPFSFTATISDDDALRGAELMTDHYNAMQREVDPAWVDVTPQAYLRARLMNWLRRERRLKDPLLDTADPEVMRLALKAARATQP